jgi:hypothetical protein
MYGSSVLGMVVDNLLLQGRAHETDISMLLPVNLNQHTQLHQPEVKRCTGIRQNPCLQHDGARHMQARGQATQHCIGIASIPA